MLTRDFAVDPHLDLRATLSPLKHGRDATIRLTAREALQASRTPEGPATLHLSHRGSRVIAKAWGTGASWALEHAPALTGCEDRPQDFRPDHPLLARLTAENPGLRMVRSGRAFELCVPTILGQKVTTEEATKSYARLCHRFGEDAPGPGGLKLPPAPELLAGLPYFSFHPLGIERKRAETIKRACELAVRIDAAAAEGSSELQSLLMKIEGIGPWTAAIVAQGAVGDPDAVIVGDYHLPNIVGWALAGRARSTDEEMLRLLEGFTGHRGRATRLIVRAGMRAPAFGPRHRIRNLAAI